jgi:hypothetical protein
MHPVPHVGQTSTQRGKQFVTQFVTSPVHVTSLHRLLRSVANRVIRLLHPKPRNSKPNPHSPRSLARFSSTRCRRRPQLLGGWVGFININDMYKMTVGQGVVYAYEAYEAK